MAELFALISWLTAFYLFVLEWDEERDGGELSVQLQPYLRMAREAWVGAVRIFEGAKGKVSNRPSRTGETGNSGLDPWD